MQTGGQSYVGKIQQKISYVDFFSKDENSNLFYVTQAFGLTQGQKIFEIFKKSDKAYLLPYNEERETNFTLKNQENTGVEIESTPEYPILGLRYRLSFDNLSKFNISTESGIVSDEAPWMGIITDFQSFNMRFYSFSYTDKKPRNYGKSFLLDYKLDDFQRDVFNFEFYMENLKETCVKTPCYKQDKIFFDFYPLVKESNYENVPCLKLFPVARF